MWFVTLREQDITEYKKEYFSFASHFFETRPRAHLKERIEGFYPAFIHSYLTGICYLRTGVPAIVPSTSAEIEFMPHLTLFTSQVFVHF